ncbi:neutral zinc metallopeptidase [Cryobacterium sp. TMT1-21]|uniref:Neutral zinc metallopeptidase n=1 Tax=Cryobacterium shii TaxID=1259235 RepID=A0AAQ2HFE1_9MICO|nr:MULTISPECIES: neutral zinc metallopeptidase [Cryobacterium]TFC46642.1 neutral zinc metallopeptidase [Cryobacterium shii]TFD17660.1 neutral zinc metallopeptidase [Cryobacterium sp. TMT1-21]TFD36242.1 neutral zinc metallopeptidase [Cryobacterium sp. TMT2-10]
MTFNDNANIGGGRVSKRGRKTGVAVGGGGLGVLALFLLSQFLGVDLTGLAGGGQSAVEPGSVSNLAECTTGAQANADVGCRMKGAAASLDTYWTEELPLLGVAYQQPQPVGLFTDSTDSGCGAASSATGPFYCPPDATIYIDTAFFDDLRTRFGSSGGPLAEMYVVAHEWGHHIQNLEGTLQKSQDGQTGAASNAVRVELQADCYAGAWAGAASETRDAGGVPFLKPITEAQIQDALSAASAVGDDRIQAATSGQVNPEAWTHGSSAQRQRWFQTGFGGGAASCDTFAPADAEL